MTNQDLAPLYGRVFVCSDIHVVTGLHIGAAAASLNVGGVDNAVLRDPLTNQPYIPGSSIRGKMRSLSEKFQQKEQNWPLAGIKIHLCRNQDAYQTCDVCRIYGILPSEEIPFSPTRLVVRDVSLSRQSVKALEDPKVKTDMPYTEVKWEAAIDRVTSAAVPRQMERVPAGVVFDNLEMVFSIYDQRDLDLLWCVIEAMQLLEDDYLGGLGSRGSGKISFQGIIVYCRSAKNGYGTPMCWSEKDLSLQQLWERRDDLAQWVKAQLFEELEAEPEAEEQTAIADTTEG